MARIHLHVSIRRYRVSFQTYQGCIRGESARCFGRDRVSSATGEGALLGVMRQEGIHFASCASVIDLETGVCQRFSDISLEGGATGVMVG